MISIIIPVFNQHDMTEECITAVRENTQGYELIIVDNGSEPPIKPPFTGFIETTLIRNEENKGFPIAVNQGIRAAKGDVIILLNNDVIVTPGWAEKLAGWLDEFDIIGPVTNYCAGLQRVTLPVYQSRDGLNEVAEEQAEAEEGHAEEVNWIIGFCMAFPKALFDQLGPFDESLWPCSGEEIDFCLRARAAGHRVGIAHDVYVHHSGSQTFNDLQAAGQINYVEICKRNDEHLAKKWGPDFFSRQAIEQPKETPTVGSHTYGAENITTFFSEEGKLSIGKYCSIGPQITVYLGGEHRTDWITTYPFSYYYPEFEGDYRISKGNVSIGNDVWIGHGVMILSGVIIGDGAVIGAGSVVASNVAPYSIVAGNPAVHKRSRFSDDQIQSLLRLQWWNWAEMAVKEAVPILQSGDISGLMEYAKRNGLTE